MKKIEITVYSFDELSEQAKQTAINNNLDINLFDNWYESIYEDAKNVGIQIQGFDIDRGAYCQIEFYSDASSVANKVLKEHGDTCDTYKTAKEFLTDYNVLVEKYSDGINKDRVTEGNEYDFDNEADELEEDFKKSISEDYRILLQKEYEYLSSEEAIQETIIENGYQFKENGEML